MPGWSTRPPGGCKTWDQRLAHSGWHRPPLAKIALAGFEDRASTPDGLARLPRYSPGRWHTPSICSDPCPAGPGTAAGWLGILADPLPLREFRAGEADERGLVPLPPCHHLGAAHAGPAAPARGQDGAAGHAGDHLWLVVAEGVSLRAIIAQLDADWVAFKASNGTELQQSGFFAQASTPSVDPPRGSPVTLYKPARGPCGIERQPDGNPWLAHLAGEAGHAPSACTSSPRQLGAVCTTHPSPRRIAPRDVWHMAKNPIARSRATPADAAQSYPCVRRETVARAPGVSLVAMVSVSWLHW